MTRITNADVPGVPNYDLDAAARPWMWHGTGAVDGDVEPFKSAPLASMFFRITAGAVYTYQKYADNKADADWAMIARAAGTIVGDMTLTGTLTAGDVSITT
jgi:hypothetical protein